MDNYDDENYDDGFDDDALAARMNLDLWKKLFGYAKRYPKDLTWLGVFAFTTACAEVAYPLITKGVVDEVAAYWARMRTSCPGFWPTWSAPSASASPSAASSGWAARSAPT